MNYTLATSYAGLLQAIVNPRGVHTFTLARQSRCPHNPSDMNDLDPHAYRPAIAAAGVVFLGVAAALGSLATLCKKREVLGLALRVVAVGFLAEALLCGWVWVTR